MRELVGERAVDLVVDPVGGDRMTDSLRSLAPEGRLLVLGFAAGEIPTVKANRARLHHSVLERASGVCSIMFMPQDSADSAYRSQRARRG